VKLYLIKQFQNTDYDTFDSAVVAANSEEEAQRTHPAGEGTYPGENLWERTDWADSPEAVEVQEIGTAKRGTKAGVICASFNAG
jgi:hypothetical protein